MTHEGFAAAWPSRKDEAGSDKIALRLTEIKPVGEGIAILVYQPDRK